MNARLTIPAFDDVDRQEFPRTLKRLDAKRAAFCGSMRNLRETEIRRLESQGNQAEDWSAIRVSADFKPDHVRGSRFFGSCFLGRFDGTMIEAVPSVPLPSGIQESTIINTVVSGECCVWNAQGVSNCFVDEGAVLYNVGTLSCSPSATFGNGRALLIGIETGGREVPSCADMTIAVARELAMRREAGPTYGRFLATYLERVRIGYGIVGAGSRICNCPVIRDAFLGEGARCLNATLVENATIQCSSEEPVRIEDGAYVRHSCIQWGSRVSSMAIVDEAVLTEHAHVERHAKVTHSVIGPNTSIAGGEVTSSLVGPFVGFHHQALLIGALWPEGKGNVAYGANVGSNHTSKAPDQEICCGEGMFFGLGASIKFPADYSHAPYSIIATGVTTLPQRVAFPFSLINTPSRRFEGVSPAYNELIPAWVLSDNLYAVRRSEAKYVERNKARRSEFPLEALRPEIIDLMVRARDALRAVSAVKDLYIGSDIRGIGKNVVTRDSLIKGLETYSLYIELYCLGGLYRRCRSVDADGKAVVRERLLTEPAESPRWEHERTLLVAEELDKRSLGESFERYVQLLAHTTRAVVDSKEKDDLRGRAIMSDYDAVRPPASQDAFVKETIAHNEALGEEIRALARRIRAD